MLSNAKRIYWVAFLSNGKPFTSFCGRNAKRDAKRANARNLSGPIRTNGAGLERIFS